MLKYIIILLIILILIILIELYKNKITFINKKNIDKILNEKSIKNYIKLNNKNLFFKRMNSNDYLNYKDNVLNFTKKEKLFLKNKIKLINKKIKKYKKLDNSWKLIKVRNNLEFGNPFTLSNYIFIPEYIIFSNNIEDTLLHEYIHINQRNNQKRYNDLYPKNLDWYLLDYNIDDSKINNKIVNPDGTNNNWYFNYKNNKIIPFLIFSNGNYIPKYYIIDNSELIEYKNHNEISNYLKKKYKINNNIYHPNEIIATILSDKIINNKKIDKKLIHFIN